MLRSDFHYLLPKSLIAQYPSEHRGGSRLLLLERITGQLHDHGFGDIPNLLDSSDMLVFNDTRVIPARLFGNKDTGGKVEVLVERVLGEDLLLAQLKASKPVRPGMQIRIGNHLLRVIERDNDFYQLRSVDLGLTELLLQQGHVPLPPYIRRQDESLDAERYQTIYAKNPGAVAAPTAGLHFSEEIMKKIRARGCKTAYVTLHVSAGTFLPVRVDDITQHKMHSEYFSIDADTSAAINQVKQDNGRIIAVGTTSVRVLESAANEDGSLGAKQGETSIFIYPGFEFKTVDAMLTNFHLPESTLLMLVCAFAGRENILNAYHHAIQEQYRFYSYGDAMFIK